MGICVCICIDHRVEDVSTLSRPVAHIIHGQLPVHPGSLGQGHQGAYFQSYFNEIRRVQGHNF